MDVGFVALCTGATIARARIFGPHLMAGMLHYGISDTQARTAMFLANVGHESLGLASIIESLNYSVEALLAKFERTRISESDARLHGRTAGRPANQRAIANLIYGGAWGKKNLGNTEPNDGWDFRGHGLLQSTGRSNAELLTTRLGARFPDLDVPDFTVTPEALSEPMWAALSACDYIDRKGLNAVADAGDFDGYCDTINKGRKTAPIGDSNGFPDRARLYRVALSAKALQ